MFLKRLVFTIGLLALGLPFVRAEKTLPDGTPVYLIDELATKTGDYCENAAVFISFEVGTEAFASFQALNDYLAGQSKYGTSNTTKVIVQVNPGSYPDAATITVPNLEFRGAQAFCDWTEYIDGNGQISGDVVYNNETSNITGNGKLYKARQGDESEIKGVISINANDITFNGFHITGAGRIATTSGTKEAPIRNIKLLYNLASESTIPNGWGKPVFQIGTRRTDANCSSNSDYQQLYQGIEISHNYFDLDCGNYPTAVGLYSVGVNDENIVTKVHDNKFHGGQTAIMFSCSQGNIEITHNRFDGVGVNSVSLDSYTMGIYDCGYFNFTKLDIENNEFIKCHGGNATYALMRILDRSELPIPHDNYEINVRYNIFTGKTKTNSAGENHLLYADGKTLFERVKYDIADNHCDNRFYKFVNVTLRDGLGMRNVYASNYALFTLTRHDEATYQYSNFGTLRKFTTGVVDDVETADEGKGASMYADYDISNHLLDVTLGSGTAMQCFDIDMLTGDIYTSQIAGSTGTTTFRSTYSSYPWVGTTDQIIHLTRLDCTKKATTGSTADDGKFTYAVSDSYGGNKTMRVAKVGEGSQIQLLHNDGALWVITGADGRPTGISTLNGTDNDISGNYIALFTWQDGADLILDPANPVKSSGYTGEVIFVKHPEATGTDDYLDTHAVVDEVNRYICFGSLSKNSAGKLVRTYCFYDLDQFIGKHIAKTYSGELALLKKISLTQGNRETVRDADEVYCDPGFEVNYPVQNFAIMGDYLYILEGDYSDNSDRTQPLTYKLDVAGYQLGSVNTSRLMLSTVNWRTGVLFKRERILEPRIGGGEATTTTTTDKKKTIKGVRVEYTTDNSGKVTSPTLTEKVTYIKEAVYSTPSGICLRPNVFGHVDFFIASASGNTAGQRKANFYKYYINHHIKSGAVVGHDNMPYTRQFDEAANANPYKFSSWQYGGIVQSVVGLALNFGSMEDELGNKHPLNAGTGYYEFANGPSYYSNITAQTTFSPTNTKVDGSFVADDGTTTKYNYNIRKNSKFGVHFEVWDEDHGTGGDKGEIALTLKVNKGSNTTKATNLEYKDITEPVSGDKYKATQYTYAYTYGNWAATLTGPGARLFTVEVEDHTRFVNDPTNGSEGFKVKLKYNGNATRHSDGEKDFGNNTFLRLTSPGAFDVVIPITLHTRSITTGVENLTDGNKDYPVEWYNVQGMRMADGVKLAPGVYIRRQGTDIKKVYIQ